MKKYGKYEKRPEGVPEKQPKVKSTLLQTYLASLLCMVLCVTMFFGTSYAWFTSEVENTGNEIYIGTLDVDLLLGDISLETNKTTKVFDNTIRWEPGYTALRDLTVVNEGNLAFNYVLNFTAGQATDPSTSGLDKVAECFEVWVYSNNAHDAAYAETEGKAFADMTAEEGWTKVGTLAEVLAGRAVFSGSMATGDVVDGSGNKKDTTHTYTIALHMKESAENTTDESGNNSLMNQSISLNVKLTAYQMGSEQDAFGTQYDYMVATAEQLSAALENGGKIVLAADINLEDTQITIPSGVTAALDLNGHDLTGSYTGADHYAMFTIPSGASLTVNGNGQVTATTTVTENNRSLAIFLNAGELTLNGGTYKLNNDKDDHTWIIAAIVDNRTTGASCATKLTINGGEYSVGGDAKNLFRNYPQQGGSATLTINDGEFYDNNGATTYIWNQEAGSNVGELYFYGGNYDAGVVYEDYNGQSDVHIADGVTINGYSENS